MPELWMVTKNFVRQLLFVVLVVNVALGGVLWIRQLISYRQIGFWNEFFLFADILVEVSTCALAFYGIVANKENYAIPAVYNKIAKFGFGIILFVYVAVILDNASNPQQLSGEFVSQIKAWETGTANSIAERGPFLALVVLSLTVYPVEAFAKAEPAQAATIYAVFFLISSLFQAFVAGLIARTMSQIRQERLYAFLKDLVDGDDDENVTEFIDVEMKKSLERYLNNGYLYYPLGVFFSIPALVMGWRIWR